MAQRFLLLTEILFCVSIFVVSILLWNISERKRSRSTVPLIPARIPRRILAACIDSIRWYVIILIEVFVFVIINVLILQEKSYGLTVESGLIRTIIVSAFGYMFANAIMAFQNTRPQQTFGKRFAHVRVVNIDGSFPRWPVLFLRSIVSVFSVFFCFVGFVTIFTNNNRQAFHDLITKTVVVDISDK